LVSWPTTLMMAERTLDIEDAKVYVGAQPAGVCDVWIQMRREVSKFVGKTAMSAKDIGGKLYDFDATKYIVMDEHGAPDPLDTVTVERDDVGTVTLSDVIITSRPDEQPAEFVAADIDVDIKE
jgi:hypothetical protein